MMLFCIKPILIFHISINNLPFSAVEIINYNNGKRLFRDFNLDGIDGVFEIDKVEDKTVAAFLGCTVSPIELFYKDQKCEILSSDVGIGCCTIDNKKELMYLNSDGWEKIEPNDKFSCEKP